MTDSALEMAPPEALGFGLARWQRVLNTAENLCKTRQLPALSLQVQRRGMTTGVHCFGSRSLDRYEPVTSDSIFLLASLTKPMMAMAVMLLVQRGKLSLNQQVSELLPQFRHPPKRPMTVRHLLSHTSGLPDMLPNNRELRMENASLARFIDAICDVDLVFPPGRGSQYQSMGYALLAPIIESVTGESYKQFLREELFEPLGMARCWLGPQPGELDDSLIAEVRVPEEQSDGEDWNWNSSYWRQLGAPWGGVLASTCDVSRFCRGVLAGGKSKSGDRLFSPAIIREATCNRLQDFPDVPERDRRSRGWGLGWRLNWKDHRTTFCDVLSGTVFGHWGATGTLIWLEPRREIAVVLLSTAPVIGNIASPLTMLSNMIAASFVDA